MRLAERGFIVLGFEPSRRLIRIAGAAADRVGQSSVAFAPNPIDPGNVQILPDADVVLVLSVFHDWCKAFGLQRSVEMLDGVWTKTRKMLFFEMPNTVENSSVRDVLPSMGASPDAAAGYIADLLSALADGVVTLLGHFPTDFRGQGERRHLFVVRRRSPEDAVDLPSAASTRRSAIDPLQETDPEVDEASEASEPCRLHKDNRGENEGGEQTVAFCWRLRNSCCSMSMLLGHCPTPFGCDPRTRCSRRALSLNLVRRPEGHARLANGWAHLTIPLARRARREDHPLG